MNIRWIETRKVNLTAAITFVESVIDAEDNHSNAIGISTNLSKSVDRIFHETLLPKLIIMGIKACFFMVCGFHKSQVER